MSEDREQKLVSYNKAFVDFPQKEVVESAKVWREWVKTDSWRWTYAGIHEALELRDGVKDEYLGKGVYAAEEGKTQKKGKSNIIK